MYEHLGRWSLEWHTSFCDLTVDSFKSAVPPHARVRLKSDVV